MEEKSIHSGHRKRVKEAFIKRDIESMPEHEILELLLFYAYSRRDTNEIAHRLIDTFGNLDRVMNTPYDELIKVKDIGENAATLIVLFSRFSKSYIRKINAPKKEFTEDELNEYLKARFYNERNEIIVMIFCDGRGQFIKATEIERGTSSETSFRRREIVEAAMRCNASKVIISHNHPHGFAVPSMADIKATIDISDLLKQLDIELSDHIIVAEGDCFSMRKSKKYKDAF